MLFNRFTLPKIQVMITILHNPRCGKSREGITLLAATGQPFEIKKYLDEPLSEMELKKLINKLGIAPIDLVRQKEKIWIEHYKNQNLSADEIIEAIAAHPILMERPIVITDTKAIIGRPSKLILDII